MTAASKKALEKFETDLVRVRHLVEAYDLVAGSGPGRRSSVQLGILRSAVVYLCRAVVDLLKAVAREHKQPELTMENPTEIAATLFRVGAGSKAVREGLTRIEPILARHLAIVKSADTNPAVGSGHHATQPLDRATVMAWATAAQEFGHALMNDLK